MPAPDILEVNKAISAIRALDLKSDRRDHDDISLSCTPMSLDVSRYFCGRLTDAGKTLSQLFD